MEGLVIMSRWWFDSCSRGNIQDGGWWLLEENNDLCLPDLVTYPVYHTSLVIVSLIPSGYFLCRYTLLQSMMRLEIMFRVVRWRTTVTSLIISATNDATTVVNDLALICQCYYSHQTFSDAGKPKSVDAIFKLGTW